MNRQRTELTRAELALAYELRQEGCSWKRIATGLSCDDHDLRSAVDRAVHVGIRFRNAESTFSRELVETALMMKYGARFGWRSIAAHFGAQNHEMLRQACYRLAAALVADRNQIDQEREQ